MAAMLLGRVWMARPVSRCGGHPIAPIMPCTAQQIVRWLPTIGCRGFWGYETTRFALALGLCATCCNQQGMAPADIIDLLLQHKTRLRQAIE